HLAVSGAAIALAAGLTLVELGSDCPPGGPLAFGSCAVRPFAISVLLLAVALYVVGLSGVLAWTTGLRRRGVADARAARDWYLLAAAIGLLVAPLLAFTVVSGLR
ncbi:MAG TPA: hypothetical protein VES36_02890, partial [Candidatus Limnocylindrales bacterium]|nr:hypothetical protein [Candidatus Limnocylindrales bacterium]